MRVSLLGLSYDLFNLPVSLLVFCVLPRKELRLKACTPGDVLALPLAPCVITDKLRNLSEPR